MKDFDENIENIKNKVNNIKLDENIKKNLEKKLNEEFDLNETNENVKKKRKFYIPKQFVAACVCVMLLSSYAFADQIGDFISNLFSNTYPEFEDGVSTEDLQKIDMEYIEHDGISIKIDYAMQKDNTIYLVFNILSEDEIKEIYLNDFEISDNTNIIFKKNVIDYKKSEIKTYDKRIKNNNILLVAQIISEDIKYKSLNEIYINILEIVKENSNNDIKCLKNNWNFKINI